MQQTEGPHGSKETAATAVHRRGGDMSSTSSTHNSVPHGLDNVQEGLERDVELGIIKMVPTNKPV